MSRVSPESHPRIFVTAVLIGTVLALLAVRPGDARADNYCVNVPVCPAPGTSYTAVQLQTALTAADAHIGPDAVIVGAGSYVGAFTSNSGADPLVIVGAGAGATILSSATSSFTLAAAGSDTTVHAMTLVQAGAGTPSGTLQLGATSTAYDLQLQIGGSVHGIEAQQGDVIHDVTITSGGAPQIGIAGYGSGIFVTDVTIADVANSGANAIHQSGAANEALTLSRVAISGYSIGIETASGTIVATDTLIQLGAIPSAVGVFLYNNVDASVHLSARLKGVTIMGTGPAQTGVFVASRAIGAQVQQSTVSDSLVDLTGISPAAIVCTQSGAGTATLAVTHSALFASNLTHSGTCVPVLSGNVDLTGLTLGFANVAGNDYTPSFGSPLIDAGTSGATAESADLLGRRRVINGGSGTAVRDIGAFEYQRPAPSGVTASADATTVTVGTAVHVTGTGVDAEGAVGSGSWTFDGGTAVPGLTATKVPLKVGKLTATFTFTGHDGVSASATVRVTVVAKPALFSAVKLLRAVVKRSGGKWTVLIGARAQRAAVIRLSTATAGVVRITMARKVGRTYRAIKGAETLKLGKGSIKLGFGGTWQRHLLGKGSYRITIASSARTRYRATSASVALTLT